MNFNLADLLLAAFIVWLIISRASQDKTMEIKKLLMLPLLSFYLLYSTINAHFILNATDIVVLCAGFVIGVSISAALRRQAVVRGDKQQQLICIAGSKTTVLMYAMILAIKVSVGYFMAQHPDAGTQFDATQCLLLLASSVAFGLPTGQALIYFIKYQSAPHEALVLARSPARARSRAR